MQPASLNFVVREPGESVRLRLHLLTPMLGGGPEQGKPDLEQPFRAKSIRGQLRWWYRRVIQVADARELWEREAALFGSAGRDSSDATPGKVRIAVRQQPIQESSLVKVSKSDAPAYAWGLFGSRETIEEKGPSVLRSHLADVVVSGLDEPGVMALWAWVYFGGVGARTRRGFGSLRIEGDAPVTIQEVIAALNAQHGSSLITGSQGVVCFLGSPQKNPTDAWRIAVDRYQAFRKGNLRTDAKRSRDGAASHSRWPEANVARKLQGRNCTKEAPLPATLLPIPRASLGLPLSLHSAKNSNDPHYFKDATFGFGCQGDRWPSPVITKALPDGKTFRPCILVVLGPEPQAQRISCDGELVPNATTHSSIYPFTWFDRNGFEQPQMITGDTARGKLISYLRFVKNTGIENWEEVK